VMIAAVKTPDEDAVREAVKGLSVAVGVAQFDAVLDHTRTLFRDLESAPEAGTRVV
jgi:hypothetical protein